VIILLLFTTISVVIMDIRCDAPYPQQEVRMQMTHRFDAAGPTIHRTATICQRDVREKLAARTYRVALIDNDTGRVHCVAGHPVIINTQDPDDASASLLRNRDPRHWSGLVQPG